MTKALAAFCWWVLISQLLYCLSTNCCTASPPFSLSFLSSPPTHTTIPSSARGLPGLRLSVGWTIKRMNYAGEQSRWGHLYAQSFHSNPVLPSTDLTQETSSLSSHPSCFFSSPHPHFCVLTLPSWTCFIFPLPLCRPSFSSVFPLAC